MDNVKMQFHPVSGTLETYIDDRGEDGPFLGFTIEMSFEEPVDPDVPDAEVRVKATFDRICVPQHDWTKIANSTVVILTKSRVSDFEGSIYLDGGHFDAELSEIKFGNLSSGCIHAKLTGYLDVWYEGDPQPQTEEEYPQFCWEVELAYDSDELQEVQNEWDAR